MTPLEIDLTLVKFDGDPKWDWWVLRRQTHDGREWEETRNGVCCYMRSDRIVPQSDVEGDARQWAIIAHALENNYSDGFKRVDVEFKGNGFLICSPRQSMDPVFISLSSAKHLAAEIRKALASAVSP